METEADRGTTFRIQLPALLNGAVETRVEEPASAPELGNNETILVAEDDQIVRGVMVRILKSAGYQTIEVSDGNEAVAAYQKHEDQIDLCILDIVMPGLTCRQAFQQIQEINNQVPVVFCTGFDPESQADDSLKSQENVRLLEKPFERNDLLSLVRELLDLEVANQE